MVTLDLAQGSTRTLLFEHEGEFSKQFPYFHSGTCFVAWYRGHGFILTAKHALAHGRERRAETLRVFAAQDKSGRSLPFDKRLEVQARPGVPEDTADVELLHIAEETLTREQSEFVRRVDLGTLRPAATRCWHQAGARFVIPGFPDDKKEIRYDDLLILEQRVVHGATMTGSVEGGRVHLVDMDEPKAHKSLNGMSGSPVFALARQGAHRVCPTFDGILTKGTLDGTATGAFICAHVIYGVLDQAVDELR